MKRIVYLYLLGSHWRSRCVLTSVRSMINADEVNATAKKKTILDSKINRQINHNFALRAECLRLRQDDTGCNEVSKRRCACSVDGTPELDRNVAKFRVVAAVAQQALGEIFVRQLQVAVQQDADLLVRHVQPDADLGLLERFVVGVAAERHAGHQRVREVLREVDRAPRVPQSHRLDRLLRIRVVLLYDGRIQMTQVSTRQVLKATVLFEWAILRETREKSSFQCLRQGSEALTIVSFISIFATANFKPVGSRPIAKQKRITCITGSAKMNNMTPTFLHMRKKFFCSKACIFPRVVI